MRPLLLQLVALTIPVQLLGQWQSIGDLGSYSAPSSQEVLLVAGPATVSVQFLAPDVCRVTLALPGRTPGTDTSWAVVRRDWPAVATSIEDTPAELRFSSSRLVVAVGKRPLRITFRDTEGLTLNSDHPGKGMSWCGDEVRVWKSMPGDESYFGLAEKAGAFQRRGTASTMWNSDIPAYDAGTDPLYVSVPFFYGLRNGRAYGIFFDNTWRSSFDFGKESDRQYSFGASGGTLDYYFFAGPTPRNILSRFTELVGRMPLPPLWSLGYQQCRWSYTPDSRVREIARTFRDKRIPCDVIYLDIDYMDGYRIFTWNPRTFPDPRALTRDLARDGFRVAVIVDPGIKTDTTYHAYRSGLAGDVFSVKPDGTPFVGDVWPGRCAFPDFASSTTRRWWGDGFSALVDSGVRGWWNDMNEPSVFNVPTKTMDADVRHNADGRTVPHEGFHNVYGMMMTLGTYEGVLRRLPGERPFVLTRASFAGGQRYSAVWTGDNVASWEHLRMSLPMCLNLGVSGFPFVGSDIGGFIGSPSGELFARWLQLGVFTPLMRAHSAIGEKNKEPWEYGEGFTAINRSTIMLRYRFLPYIYSAMRASSRTGIPAMRPVVFDHPSRERYLRDVEEFLFGDHLLVAPALHEGQTTRTVTLPPGEWYDFYSGRRYRGDTTITVPAPIDRLPLFAAAGAAIPLRQPVQYTDEVAIDTLTLAVFPPSGAGGPTGSYYEDDGRSFAYLKGVSFERTMTVSRASDTVRVLLSAAQGSYVPRPRVLRLEIAGLDKEWQVHLPGKPQFEHLSGTAFAASKEGWTYEPTSGRVVARLSDRPGEIEVLAIRK
jgi:alpha-glucosidase